MQQSFPQNLFMYYPTCYCRDISAFGRSHSKSGESRTVPLVLLLHGLLQRPC